MFRSSCTRCRLKYHHFPLFPWLQTVYQVVGASLAAETGADDSKRKICRSFELFVAPPTRVLARDSTSLEDASILAPACVLHLRWKIEAPEVDHWVQKLEDNMQGGSDSSARPRVSYSSR